MLQMLKISNESIVIYVIYCFLIPLILTQYNLSFLCSDVNISRIGNHSIVKFALTSNIYVRIVMIFVLLFIAIFCMIFIPVSFVKLHPLTL